ncbi:GNAT family N-acetyltransferase [Peribacillus sp. SCS-26]|uniref:GNAT family N-acetyltransferase n=1 Tax=Paraperibacillus marinus TaxID=3115295 RepID=UPI003906202D
MTVRLVPASRDNWLEAISLTVHEKQRGFVPSAAVSLAKVHIKPDGDQVVYLPFCIYHHDRMAGFIMHAYEEGTEAVHWINGFFIAAAHQGHGYGMAALLRMIEYICTRFSRCREIRLTVHRDNPAAAFYQKAGFEFTGELYGAEKVMRLQV